MPAPEFAPAHAKTSAHEAGYANHASDKGGETWRGIARKFWPTWEGWGRIDAAKKVLRLSDVVLQVSAKARQQLTTFLDKDADLTTLVAEFYQREFWDRLGILETDFQEWAEYAYDKAVNFGLPTGKDILATMRKVGT